MKNDTLWVCPQTWDGSAQIRLVQLVMFLEIRSTASKVDRCLHVKKDIISSLIICNVYILEDSK